MSPRPLARVLEDLYARVPLGMRLGLDAMRDACARAGHPENAFKSVHIAGTNGKGSTCAMVEAFARAAGKKTGLYTSPHLRSFAERIRINGEPVSDEVLRDGLERALELGRDLSFFETATLAAFLVFRDQNVDIAVIEVGIGGRLDATNVIAAPAVTALTRVAFDHMDKLGSTLEAIAREKAGIAKPGVPLLLGPLAPEVCAAASAVALAAGARVVTDEPEHEFLADHKEATSALLKGSFQRENARLAERIARALGISENAIRQGLAQAQWPGRFETVHIDENHAFAGLWLLDGAHNPDGAQALVHALERERGLATPGALAFGALADKEWRAMLDVLCTLACPRFYVAPRGRAAADPAELANHAPGRVMKNVSQALQAARHVAGAQTVVVCGSLYLVGEARARLLDLPEDPPVGL